MAASSSATTAPPNAVKSAAPASGATSRSPSRTVCSTALASASSSSRQQGGQQRRLAGAEHRVREPVDGGDRVEDPDVAAVVDEQQRQHGRSGGEVGDDQQPPARDAVDEQAGQRREQRRRGDEEHDHAGGRAAAGQHLGPHAERQPHRAVAEQRERLAGDVEPHVPAGAGPGASGLDRVEERRCAAIGREPSGRLAGSAIRSRNARSSSRIWSLSAFISSGVTYSVISFVPVTARHSSGSSGCAAPFPHARARASALTITRRARRPPARSPRPPARR